MDDTRDIAIAVRAEVGHLKDEVTGLRSDVKALTEAHQQRIGAERIARWIIGLGGGATGAALIKAGSYIGGLPIK